jgi:hypothetical protein
VPVLARHTEIAQRYRKQERREPFSIAAKRVAELTRLFHSRYGPHLPDDDSGMDDAFVMANHLALRPDAHRRIPLWLELNAPWMTKDEIQSLTAKAISKPCRWRADTLAVQLNLMEAERRRLGITTIGAVDLDKAARTARRGEQKRMRKERSRRANGAVSRAEYEAKSLSRTKPWEALGMSRRTWYRRHGKSRGTSAAPA